MLQYVLAAHVIMSGFFDKGIPIVVTDDCHRSIRGHHTLYLEPLKWAVIIFIGGIYVKKLKHLLPLLLVAVLLIGLLPLGAFAQEGASTDPADATPTPAAPGDIVSSGSNPETTTTPAETTAPTATPAPAHTAEPTPEPTMAPEVPEITRPPRTAPASTSLMETVS